ncbi:hypothetical protein SmJEL517_g02283 [Synchytrium microbalum]|uniref:Protein OS-9 homolog n=1 Tax=Synchytrium microbalum TaxID=1806994 RepID=A0A507CCQ5_9FUNG|nr:uncharacterized protein SmJEL517_g02283 [Synchytrium microbalum]TPX35323.1 hypothetical protein SmJEL517_g02283 [Synchytrium microbalum]
MDSIHADLHRSPAYQLTDPSVVTLPLPGTGLTFQCLIGNPDTQASKVHTTSRDVNLSDPSVRKETVTNALAQLEPLKKSGCLYYNQGWWTFEFCYGSHIRQFHQVQPQEAQDPKVKTEYILGRFKVLALADTRQQQTTQPASDLMDLPKEGKRYLRQHYGDGTMCDLTNQPRSVEVQFHCAQPTDQIALIKETATCQYLLVVHTPRLCRDAAFLAPQSARPVKIECHPMPPPLGLKSSIQAKSSDIDNSNVQEKGQDGFVSHSIFDYAAARKLGDGYGYYLVPELLDPYSWTRVDMQRGDDSRIVVRKHASSPPPSQQPPSLAALDSEAIKTLSRAVAQAFGGAANPAGRMQPNGEPVDVKVVVIKDGEQQVVGNVKEKMAMTEDAFYDEGGDREGTVDLLVDHILDHLLAKDEFDGNDDDDEMLLVPSRDSSLDDDNEDDKKPKYQHKEL